MARKEILDSGLLELYVLGLATAEEAKEVELLAATDPEIGNELDAIGRAMEKMATLHAMEPNPVIKPFLMATIDYTERLKNGEQATEPPILTEKSTPADYDAWLNRPDMVSPNGEDVFARIIGYNEKAITAIVWIKDFAPAEVHDNESERFLILEGTCDIIVDDTPHHLVPGDYFAIPLHKDHMVKVTSGIPCKVILQRVAA